MPRRRVLQTRARRDVHHRRHHSPSPLRVRRDVRVQRHARHDDLNAIKAKHPLCSTSSYTRLAVSVPIVRLRWQPDGRSVPEHLLGHRAVICTGEHDAARALVVLARHGRGHDHAVLLRSADVSSFDVTQVTLQQLSANTASRVHYTHRRRRRRRDRRRRPDAHVLRLGHQRDQARAAARRVGRDDAPHPHQGDGDRRVQATQRARADRRARDARIRSRPTRRRRGSSGTSSTWTSASC